MGLSIGLVVLCRRARWCLRLAPPSLPSSLHPTRSPRTGRGGRGGQAEERESESNGRWKELTTAKSQIQMNPLAVGMDTHTSTGTPKLSPKSLPELPKGWGRHMDENSGLPYYFNQFTGKTQWEFPKPRKQVRMNG